MTQILIDTSDARDIRAIQVAMTANRWTRTKTGAFRIPSQSGPAVHTVTAELCTCPDFRHHTRPCKHVRAVRLYNAFERAAKEGR